MKKFTLVFTLVLMSYFTFSQNWQKRNSTSDKMNFYEIQNSFQQDLQDGKVSPTDSEFKQYKRWENYWKDRVLEDGSFINPMHTYNELEKYLEKNSQFKGDANWSFIGPKVLPEAQKPGYPGLGRVNAIAFDPTDSNTIWVGSPAGGLWKSSDAGVNWSTTTDNLPSLGISDIAIDPTNKQIMYIATGDADGKHSNSLGVLKSTDGGATWVTTGLNYTLNETRQTARIVQDHLYPSYLTVSTSNGIYVTTDGGGTWAQSTGTDGISFSSLMNKADNVDVIFAGSLNGGIYKSEDWGQSFTQVHTSGTGRVELAKTAANPNFIFAFFQDGTGAISNDAGATWSVQTMPQNGGNNIDTQTGYNMCVAIAPNNANLIIVGAMNYAYRTTDGGNTWEGYLDGYWTTGKPYFYVHSDHHVLEFLPGSNSILFSGNDGGLHKGDITTNNAWTDLTAGLFITQFYGLGGTPQHEYVLLAGAQDNDAMAWNGDNNEDEWKDINNNTDGIDGLIDYSDANIVYASSQAGILTRTLDGYDTEEVMLEGPANEEADFTWPIVMDPITPTTIYGGWKEIYKSTDKGDTWTAISNNQLNGNKWTHIAIAPSDPNTVYAGDGESVWKTTNGGTSWENVKGNNFPTSNITRMAVNSTNPSNAFIVFAGYEEGKKVYETTNAGTDWNNISGSLPNVPVKCIVYQTGASDDLYIGTDLGVYHKDNKKSDWVAYNTNLPNTIVNDMEIHYSSQKIRAATYGRGIWESPFKTYSGTDEINYSNSFEIFPNPSNGVFRINIENQNTDILIYNMAGGVVKNINKATVGNINIDLSSHCNGTYFVSIKSGAKQQTAKLIIR